MPKIKFRELFSFKKQEIDEAFKKARFKAKWTKSADQRAGLKLLVGDAPGAVHGKLLIIIPKKTGKASLRNRIRRQIRSIFYEENLYEKPTVGILFVYKEAAGVSFDELKQFLVGNLANGSKSRSS